MDTLPALLSFYEGNPQVINNTWQDFDIYVAVDMDTVLNKWSISRYLRPLDVQWRHCNGRV